VRAIPIVFYPRVGPSGDSSKRRAVDVELHRRAPRGGAQASSAACFFERGLHPTEESGQCRWRHRRLEPLARAFVRRELRRVSVGAVNRRELLGARAGALQTSGSTLRCRDRRCPREWVPRMESTSRHSVASKARGGSLATRTESDGKAELGRSESSATGRRRGRRAEDATQARGFELVSGSCCRREFGRSRRLRRRRRRFRHDSRSSPGTARWW
jgi:hypothetical protein